jgi:hypothetical protein
MIKKDVLALLAMGIFTNITYAPGSDDSGAVVRERPVNSDKARADAAHKIFQDSYDEIFKKYYTSLEGIDISACDQIVAALNIVIHGIDFSAHVAATNASRLSTSTDPTAANADAAAANVVAANKSATFIRSSAEYVSSIVSAIDDIHSAIEPAIQKFRESFAKILTKYILDLTLANIPDFLTVAVAFHQRGSIMCSLLLKCLEDGDRPKIDCSKLFDIFKKARENAIDAWKVAGCSFSDRFDDNIVNPAAPVIPGAPVGLSINGKWFYYKTPLFP